eukprot:1540124-Ditylum_brightwellii.AAC.2
MEEDEEEVNLSKLDKNTEMNSIIKKQDKPKIHQMKKECSTTNDCNYYGPTSYEEEEIISSYSSSRG